MLEQTVNFGQTQQMRILCVDDNDVILSTLKSAFKAAGVEVETAYNGFNALAKISKNPKAFHAITTDLRMPGIDGFSLIEKSRSIGYSAPIIVYAAAISPEDRERLQSLQITQMIEKPARSSALLAAIRESLGEAGPQ
ncbi:MAG: response regulator [Chthoniobacterales bacterium]